jgi:integrase
MVVKRFLAFHGNVGLVEYRPRLNGSSRTRVDWLTPDECKRIFDTEMADDQSVLIGAGLLQGLRRIETIRMTAGEARRAINSRILSVRGKTGPRSISLQEDFSIILERYLAGRILSDDQLLLNMKRSKSEKRLHEFSQRYGKKFGFHTLRRSFGRNLWLLGIPIETISELYGHEGVDMTRMYLGVGISDMSKALSGYRFGIARLVLPEPEKLSQTP